MFAEKYSQYYDLFNADKPYKKEIEFVYRWANKPKWIFDVGPGTANYWKFYPKGTYILGVDKSPAMAGTGKNIICADITTYIQKGRFDCATALFDVVNYIPTHTWWKNIPLEHGGYWVFDLWDKKKVDKEGFRKTVKIVGNLKRTIRPFGYDKKSVDLEIKVEGDKFSFVENHKMFLYSHEDIKRFCGSEFKILQIKETKTWQRWYLCKKR